MSAIDKEVFPRGALIGAAALIALTLVAAAGGRWQQVHAPTPPPFAGIAVQESVDLRFEDRDDGSVVVRNAADGALLQHVTPNEGAFLRIMMRNFVKHRAVRGQGSTQPFRLTLYVDGRLIVSDPVSGRHADLRAFGVDQHKAFARLLPSAAMAAARSATTAAAGVSASRPG
jgi:putative photosynthetic complex assembly protein